MKKNDDLEKEEAGAKSPIDKCTGLNPPAKGGKEKRTEKKHTKQTPNSVS